MKRMITFSEAKSILALDSISPYNNNRDIWKSQAITYGAVLNSPYSESSWALNRLLPVDVAMKQMYKITFDPNNGGQDAPYTIRVAAGVTPSPTTPTYSGYNFAGWSPTLAPASADTTYTAQWTPIIPTYTITYLKSDGSAYTTRSVLQGDPIPVLSQGTESNNWSETLVNPNPNLLYSPTGWFLQNDSTKKLGSQITRAYGNYVFISTFNHDDKPNNNIKIFDLIGLVKNITKSRPNPNYPNDPTNQDVGRFIDSNWYSLVHDGHGPSENNADVLGADMGISPSEAQRQAHLLASGGTYIARHSASITENGVTTTYYGYTGDSIVYEYFNITDNYTAYRGSNVHQLSGFKTEASNVVASDLIDEIVFYDSNHNETLHIKVNENNPWIKFAIVDLRGNSSTINFFDVATYDPASSSTPHVTVNVPLLAEIVYYIADNTATGAKARCGKVDVTTKGGKCSYVIGVSGTPFTTDNNDYMTAGTVLFYQLGPNYSGKLP